MASIKNDFIPVSMYNEIPFIGKTKLVAEHHKDDLEFLTDLLEKHNLPANVYIKLMHIHSRQEEGNIVAWSELDSRDMGKIPFLAPMTPRKDTQVRGCHYFVDNTGSLQAFEYTTNKDCLDLAAYPVFVTEFCAYIVQHELQMKFGLGIKSGVAEHGYWTEIGFPEKRATFLLQGDINVPELEGVTTSMTITQFLNPKATVKASVRHGHGHAEFSRPTNKDDIDGVTTIGGLALGGQPLPPNTDFYRVASIVAAAA